jgi:KDO2-lipid IV(A) lauroyltransferase
LATGERSSWTNLRNAFPEKKNNELKKIARKFYRNFTDNWIETIKLLSISKAALNKRVSSNVDVFINYIKRGDRYN